MSVLLILVDGMRPDSLEGVSVAQEFLRRSAYTLSARTVMPSSTLPCHMSLFHSVDPWRHGVTTNVYTPQVRPIRGLCEVLRDHKRKSAFFYNWGELRDLAQPNSLSHSFFANGSQGGWPETNRTVAAAAMEFLQTEGADFTFLYLGSPDAAGHRHGWMSPEYRQAVADSWELIRAVCQVIPEDTTVIITADHGGHDRMHGMEAPEDMTIPMLLLDKNIAPGALRPDADIKDIAPTIVGLLGLEPDEEWEGKTLL